jgi:hypothetical protein
MTLVGNIQLQSVVKICVTLNEYPRETLKITLKKQLHTARDIKCFFLNKANFLNFLNSRELVH